MVRAVAVVGCDGSGKSTLVAGLVAHLAADGPVECIYLGQSSGRIGAWIGHMPFIGGPCSRYLVRKSERMHEDAGKPIGGMPALVVYALSAWRAHKFRRMLALSRRGVLVVTDRYPQADAPGFHFDGPELPTKPPGSGLVRALTAREKRLYQRMASHVPALVIRLGVDIETARARKPDHREAMLREKIRVLPTLGFNGAPILDLDGRAPAAVVLDAALRAVAERVGAPRT